jgi:HK97 family phage prohead protease
MFTIDTTTTETRTRGYATLTAARASSRQSIGSVSGILAPYGVPSRDLGGGVVDIYERGCFRNWLASGSDFVFLFERNPRLILGRGRAKTATCFDSPDGLAYTLELPATSYGKDVSALLARGDLDSCEAVCYVLAYRWQSANGQRQRVIERAALVAASICSWPDFDAATAALLTE